MIELENTTEHKQVRNVIATLAVENMFLTEEFTKELIAASEGKITTEQLRQKTLAGYKIQNKQNN